MAEKQAKNDAFVAYLSNPEANVDDYLQNGITADNTQFLDKDEYKRTPLVLKLFAKDGVFDEWAFNKVYEQATKKYLDLNDEKAFQNYLTWGSDSNYAPLDGERRSNDITPYTGNNPDKVSYSIVGLNAEGDAKYTKKELALMGKIWDSDNKQWLEGTAESQNLLKSALGKTLVYALYDKDGIQINPITGQEEYHKKGEWMTDEDGNYFTMTVSDEDIRSRQVVSFEDILTKEDSWLNNLDFFDSDGKDKSIPGIAMKTLVKSLPYFIPTVGSYYGAAVAASTFASNIPTILKALDSAVLRDTPDSTIYKGLTNAENWFKKFTPSLSENAEKSFISFEGVGTMIADTVGLLSLLSAAGSLAKYFYKIPEMKGVDGWKAAMPIILKQNKTALKLALGYMAIELASSTYNDALNAGYDNRVAGVTALASAGALYGIMNFNESTRGLGTWFLNKTTGYDKDFTMSPLLKLGRKKINEAAKVVEEAATGKTGILAAPKYFADYWRDARSWFLQAVLEGNESTFKNAIVEGIEEISEEAILDTVKGIVDIASSLGLCDLKGSFGGLSNVFSKEGASRYLLTLLGGAFGGAIFDVQLRKIQPWFIRTFLDANYKSPFEDKVTDDIIDVSLLGRIKDYIDALNKLRKTANPKKGYTEYTNEAGVQETLLPEGTKTLVDAIVDSLIDEARTIDVWVKNTLGMDAFGQLDEFTKNLAMQTWGALLKDYHIEDYFKARFSLAVKQAYNSYESWRAKELTEKSSTDSTKSSEDSDVTTKELFKKLFEADRDALLKFFTGKQGLLLLAEANLITRKDLLLPYLIGLDEKTFYDVYIKNPTIADVAYENLPSGPDNMSTRITKEYVHSEYEKYRGSLALTTTTELLLSIIPRITLILVNMNKLVSKDLKDFSKHLNKEALIKYINRYKPIDLYEDYVDSLAEEEIFNAEELALFNTKSAELKDKLLKDRRRLVKESLMEQNSGSLVDLRAGAIDKIIESNYTSFLSAGRINFDLALILIDNGVISFNLSEDPEAAENNLKFINIYKDLVNQTAIDSGINRFTKKSIEELLKAVNKKLSSKNNLFVLALAKASGSEDSSVIDTAFIINPYNLDVFELESTSLKVLDELLADIKKLSELIEAEKEELSKTESGREKLALLNKAKADLVAKLNSQNKPFNIKFAKYNAVLELIKDGSIITPDLLKEANTFMTSEMIAAVQDTVSELGIDPVTVINEEKIASIKPNVTSLLSSKNDIDDSIAVFTENIIGCLSSSIDEVIFGGVTLTEELINNFKEILKTKIEPTVKTYRDIVATKKLVKNPLFAMVSKVYTSMFGTETPLNILEYIKAKTLGIQSNSDFSFTEDEILDVKNASAALTVLDAVLSGSIKYGEGMLPNINEIQREYIELYGDKKDLELFPILTALEGEAVRNYITELQVLLKRFLYLNDDVTKNKSEAYQALHVGRCQAIINLANNRHLMKFTISLPDKEDFVVDLLEGVDPNLDSIADIDLKALKIEETLHKNLTKLYNDNADPENEATSKELFTQAIFKAVSNILYRESDSASKIPFIDMLHDGMGWNSILASNGIVNKINGLFLVKKLLLLTFTSPREQLLFITDMYKNNPSVSIREDLMEAAINLEFALNNKDIISYLLNARLEYIAKQPDDVKATINLVAEEINNVHLLMGSGGSGKTALIEWFARMHKDLDIYVTAKNQSKVDDLASKFNKDTYPNLTSNTIYSIFEGLEGWDKAFSSSLAAVLNWINGGIKSGKLKKSGNLGDITDAFKKYTFESKDNDNVKVEYTNKEGRHILQVTVPIGSSKLEYDLILDNSGTDIDGIHITTIPNEIKISGFKENSIFILDEATLVSPLFWALINKVCTDNNSTMFAVCDPALLGYSIKDGNDIRDFDLSNYSFNLAGDLFGSWRSDNTAMNLTNTALYKAIIKPKNLGNKLRVITDLLERYNITSGDIPTILEDLQAVPKFVYTLSNNKSKFKFLGTRVEVDNNKEAIKGTLSVIDNIPDVSKAVIVNNSVNTPDEKLKIKTSLGLDDSWSILTIEEALGLEFDYTVLYKLDRSSFGLLLGLKTLFTALTRAKKGLLVITSDGEADLVKFYELPSSDLSATIKEFESEAKDSIALKFEKTIQDLLEASTDFGSSAIPKNSVKGKTSNPVTVVYEDLPETEPIPDKTTWADSGIKLPIGIGTWYTRLGIHKEKLKVLLETEIEGQNAPTKWALAYQTLLGSGYTDPNNPDSDLYAFVLLVHIYYNEHKRLEYGDDKAGSNLLNEFIRQHRSKVENITLFLDIVNLFVEFKHWAAENLNLTDYIFLYDLNNDPNYNYAFEKFNNDTNLTVTRTIGLAFYVNGTEENKGGYKYITLGACFYDAENTITIEQGKHVIYKRKSEDTSEAKDFKTSLNTYTGNNLLFIAPGVGFYTKGIDMRLKPELHDTNSQLAEIPMDRISLQALLNTNYEIISGNDAELSIKNGLYVNPLNPSEEYKKEAFIKWYNQFRTTPLSQEYKAVIGQFYNDNWTLIRKKGCKFWTPIRISTVANMNLADSTYFSNSSSKNRTNQNQGNGNYIKRFTYYLLLLGLKYKVRGSFPIPHKLEFKESVSEDFENIVKAAKELSKVAKDKKSQIQEKLKELIDLLLTEKSKKEIDNFLTYLFVLSADNSENKEILKDIALIGQSYINLLYRNALYTHSLFDIKGRKEAPYLKSLTVPGEFDNYIKTCKDNSNMLVLKQSDTNGVRDLLEIINKHFQDQNQKFFYTEKKITSVDDAIQNDAVTDFVCEPAKMVLSLACFDSIEEGGVPSSGPSGSNDLEHLEDDLKIELMNKYIYEILYAIADSVNSGSYPSVTSEISTNILAPDADTDTPIAYITKISDRKKKNASESYESIFKELFKELLNNVEKFKQFFNDGFIEMLGDDTSDLYICGKGIIKDMLSNYDQFDEEFIKELRSYGLLSDILNKC